jgi:hypothetical protein
VIGQWEKLFTPSTPFQMTPSSGESIGLTALRIMRVFQANRSSRFSGAVPRFSFEIDLQNSDALLSKNQWNFSDAFLGSVSIGCLHYVRRF